MLFEDITGPKDAADDVKSLFKGDGSEVTQPVRDVLNDY